MKNQGRALKFFLLKGDLTRYDPDINFASPKMSPKQQRYFTKEAPNPLDNLGLSSDAPDFDRLALLGLDPPTWN